MLNPYRMFKKLKVNLNMEFWSSKIKPDEQNSDYCNRKISIRLLLPLFHSQKGGERKKKDRTQAGERHLSNSWNRIIMAWILIEYRNWLNLALYSLPIAFPYTLNFPTSKLTRFLSTSSGTFLVELQSALAALWEKITGALVVCRAALIVLVETWERSTSIPSLFSSLTTAWKIIKKNNVHISSLHPHPSHFKLRPFLLKEKNKITTICNVVKIFNLSLSEKINPDFIVHTFEISFSSNYKE